MPNPQLTKEQQLLAQELLAEVRALLDRHSNSDPATLFALRRKVQKELMHDERGKPAHRNRIKNIKRIEQGGLCPICKTLLPEKDAVLDRFEAIDGYTVENTRLIHAHCDRDYQKERGYA